MSEYKEWYKKHRPQQWDEVIGQDKVVKGLQSNLEKNNVPAAYGFWGERGVGKTTLALLLAKALNCQDIQEGGNPCNKCNSCIGVDNNTNPDIYYQSMANEGTVENIRKLMEESTLSPLYNRRVYIFDEVHRLSPSAFDAMLIPIEDNNVKALFILCSTESKKIPTPILSRIKTRNISLVGFDLMSRHVKRVLEAEGESLTDEQISEVCRKGKGSVRDTLNILESFVNGSDEEELDDYSTDLLSSLKDLNPATSLAVVAAAMEGGEDALDLAETLFSDLRDLLLLSCGSDRSLTPEFPIDDFSDLTEALQGSGGIIYTIDEIGSAINNMGMNADTRVQLEIGLIKAIMKVKKYKKMVEAKKG